MRERSPGPARSRDLAWPAPGQRGDLSLAKRCSIAEPLRSRFSACDQGNTTISAGQSLFLGREAFFVNSRPSRRRSTTAQMSPPPPVICASQRSQAPLAVGVTQLTPSQAPDTVTTPPPSFVLSIRRFDRLSPSHGSAATCGQPVTSEPRAKNAKHLEVRTSPHVTSASRARSSSSCCCRGACRGRRCSRGSP